MAGASFFSSFAFILPRMPYRFAIIGCGRIAARHAEQISRENLLVAVCDTDAERVQEFARAFGAKAFREHEQMLADTAADVVVVCSPNGLHLAHAHSALNAGSHVLCEKPLGIASKEALQLIETARQCKRRLFVVKQNRYNPPVAFVKALLQQQALGEITGFQINCFWQRPDSYYKNSWRGTKALDGGILFTQFSHFMDLLHWFLGPLKEAAGWRANFQHKSSIEFEDAGAATLVLATGAIGSINYTINTYPRNLEGSFTIFGTEGTVKVGGEYLDRLEHYSGDQANYKEFLSSIKQDTNYSLLYDDLIQTLNDPAQLFLEGEEALESIKMIEMIYASSPFIKTGT